MSVGIKIRNWRKERGLTQKKLGEKSGLNEVTIRKYESGTIIPKITNMTKIAEALEIPIEDFYSEEEARSGAVKALTSLTQDLSKEIERQHHEVITKYKSLNRTGQKEALKRLDEMARLEEYKLPKLDIKLKYD